MEATRKAISLFGDSNKKVLLLILLMGEQHKVNRDTDQEKTLMHIKSLQWTWDRRSLASGLGYSRSCPEALMLFRHLA